VALWGIGHRLVALPCSIAGKLHVNPRAVRSKLEEDPSTRQAQDALVTGESIGQNRVEAVKHSKAGISSVYGTFYCLN